MTILPNPTAAPSAIPQRTDARRASARVTERLRTIPTIVEPPRPAPDRLVDAEPDYRAPTPRERGRLLLSAYDASMGDTTQRLLLAELMAQYRTHCLQRGFGDPYAETVPARAMRDD